MDLFPDSSTSWLKEAEVSLPWVQMLSAVPVLLILILSVKIGSFSSSFKSEERISIRGESIWDNDKLPVPCTLLSHLFFQILFFLLNVKSRKIW